jgi:hypothetical protein
LLRSGGCWRAYREIDLAAPPRNYRPIGYPIYCSAASGANEAYNKVDLSMVRCGRASNIAAAALRF